MKFLGLWLTAATAGFLLLALEIVLHVFGPDTVMILAGNIGGKVYLSYPGPIGVIGVWVLVSLLQRFDA